MRTQRDLSIFLKNSPADLITIPGEDQTYKARIRSLLIHQKQDILNCPDFDSLAKHFNLGAQTLRRKLNAEGTSYPQIKDDIRKDLAIERLLSNSSSIADIARSLGFSESRSFTRAFKKWTGFRPNSIQTNFLKNRHKKAVQAITLHCLNAGAITPSKSMQA